MCASFDVEVRAVRPTEVPLPVRWAAEEGWNPGLQDCDVFLQADPGGLLVVDAQGRPVGAISATRVSPGVGFIGFFVVMPAFRGLGYGRKLWRAGLGRLSGHVIGLDSEPANQPRYQREGFVSDHRSFRCRGPAPRLPGLWHPEVKPADTVPFAALAEYDAACSGGLRPRLLRAWLALPHSRALVWLRDGAVCGLGMARRSHEGVRIGPLFADDEAGAEALFSALAGLSPGADLVLDLPEPNVAALALARRHGLSPRVEAARMYRGPAPSRPLRRIYGVTSCALG